MKFPLLLLKFVISTIVLAATLVINAATTSWKDAWFEYEGNFQGKDYYTLFEPFLCFNAISANNTIEIFAQAESYMEFANKFISANKGDTVTTESIDNSSSYFLWSDFDHGDNPNSAFSNYSLLISVGESAYLAFSTASYTDSQNPTYGWFEISSDSDGILHIDKIAIGDGGPMIVGGGAIPEPGSGLLLLLGVAGIALRRRKAANACLN